MVQLQLQIKKPFKIACSSFVRTILIGISLVAVGAPQVMPFATSATLVSSLQLITEFQPKPQLSIQGTII